MILQLRGHRLLIQKLELLHIDSLGNLLALLEEHLLGKKTAPSVRKTTSISPVGSKVQPSKSTSSKTVTPGSREVTTVPIPKAAGRTDNEIKAPPIKVETPVKRSTREDIIYSKRKKENETREEFDKRDKEEDERLNKNALKNQRKGDGNEGKIMTGKNQGTTCRTC